MGERTKRQRGRQNKVITISVLKLESIQVPPEAAHRSHPAQMAEPMSPSPGFHTNTSCKEMGAGIPSDLRSLAGRAHKVLSQGAALGMWTCRQLWEQGRQAREPRAAMDTLPGQLEPQRICPPHAPHGPHQGVLPLPQRAGYFKGT